MDINFHPAVPENSELAGELILATMGRLGEVVYGLDDPGRAARVLSQLFSYPNNRYSYTKAVIAEVDGKAAGLLLSFPGSELARLEAAFYRQVTSLYSYIDLLRMAWRFLPMLPGIEAENDEYYIAHIAVLPELQGKGTGRRLMSLAEEKCCKAGLKKCSLCVDFGHETARQLYLKLGYQVVERIVNPPKTARRLKWGGYERMVKSIQ